MSSLDTSENNERDQLISDLQEMLVTVISDAETAIEQADERRELELKSLALKLRTAEFEKQRLMNERLARLGEAIHTLQNTAGEIGTNDAHLMGLPQAETNPVEGRLNHIESMIESLISGGPPKPLLASVLDRWRETKIKQGVAQRNVDGQINRIKNFIEFAGERPLNEYKFLDFQEYANVLGRVPADWRRLPQMRDGTVMEAAEYNDQLPPKRRHRVFTKVTISEKYLSPLRSIFRDMAGQHDFPNPFLGVSVRVPVVARESVERQPLATDELNRWFRQAAHEVRADLKWLPLLATVTGARLAELVFLQGKDVLEITPGVWAADLEKPLENVEGEEEERPTKNKGSKRLFALHDVLKEVGFIDYVLTRRDDDWVFPHAHGKGTSVVKDPASAASKRVNRRLKEVGIHKEYESTFHSTRHSAKDIMRDGAVPEHTHDMQTGHVTKTVARGYGAKRLRDKDVELLAALPLPEGLDLSPYLKSVKRR
ncbi:MAG: tyrosine-type recombinase/integrase [Hyphomicrobiales bacterium]